MAQSLVRVRAVLDSLTKEQTAALKKLLPPAAKIKCPTEFEQKPYPSMVLTQLNTPDKYAICGLATEDLLKVESPTVDHLFQALSKYSPLTPAQKTKLTNSITTQPFLDAIQATREQLLTHVKGELLYDTVLRGTHVEGHPDCQAHEQIFEIKVTADLKKNWTYFLFQLFSYAALAPDAKEIFLVLPLQTLVWKFPLTQWKKRTEFKAFIEARAEALPAQAEEQAMKQLQARLLFTLFPIGNHIQKKKTLPLTISTFPSYSRPYQIFLSGNMNTRLSIQDAELAETGSLVQRTGAKLFIHSPYIINLCMPRGTNDNYHTNLLMKNLEYGAKAGARGVVVHVGKTTTQDPEQAIAHMLENVLIAMEAATPECPLLLETPAGQGTECLRTYEEFVDFVAQIDDPRLRICVDTCHIFACGHEPLSYIDRILSKDRDLLRLVHYNDSAQPCGSCVDRHAFPGVGCIGLDTMTHIAERCYSADVPMLYE